MIPMWTLLMTIPKEDIRKKIEWYEKQKEDSD